MSLTQIIDNVLHEESQEHEMLSEYEEDVVPTENSLSQSYQERVDTFIQDMFSDEEGVQTTEVSLYTSVNIFTINQSTFLDSYKDDMYITFY